MPLSGNWVVVTHKLNLQMHPILENWVPRSVRLSVCTGETPWGSVLFQLEWACEFLEWCSPEECLCFQWEAGSSLFVYFSLHDTWLKTDNSGKQHHHSYAVATFSGPINLTFLTVVLFQEETRWLTELSWEIGNSITPVWGRAGAGSAGFPGVGTS